MKCPHQSAVHHAVLRTGPVHYCVVLATFAAALPWAHDVPVPVLAGDLTSARLSDVSKSCKDPAFFDAAVSALNSRHVYKQAIWKWAVVHLHAPALKQLLMNSQLTQKLQTQYNVPMARLLDSVFGRSGDALDDWVLCDGVVRHLEYWPSINPYCRPITHSECSCKKPFRHQQGPTANFFVPTELKLSQLDMRATSAQYRHSKALVRFRSLSSLT